MAGSTPRCARSSSGRPGSLPGDEREALCRRVLLLATGLGPLEPLLSDPSVDEVMVNGPGEVYVERRGRIEPTGVSFGGEAELMHAIERILAPLGRRVDEASPLCDARLADGSRVNVVIPPLSLDGPCLTVRRFRHEGYSLRELVALGTLPGEVAELLALCVAARAAVLVSGGTGSGQDDDARRPVGRDPRRGADRDHRGRGRAAAAPAPRGAAGVAAGERGGPRGGDDPAAGGERAADAAGPDRGGGGARRRGARHAPGAQHRPRRLARRPCTRTRRRTRCAGSRRSR